MERYKAYKDSGVEWIGEIPSGWYISTVGRIGQLGRGRVISNIEIKENSGSYPVYSSQTKNGGVMGYLDSYDFDGEYVLWTTDGANAGTVTRRVGRFNCTNVCGTLQPKNWDEIDLRFLPFFLNLGTSFSVRLDINPKLMNGMMAKIPLALPPKDEQTAIANYLDFKTAEIDELIAQKERLLALYEEEKTAIINHAVTKGLDPNAELKDSGVEWLGEIPDGWEMKKLVRIVEKLTNGYVGPTREIMRDSGVPYIQGIHIKNYSIRFTPSGNYYVEKDWSINHSKSILKTGDLLVVQTGSIGDVGIVEEEFDGANCHALLIVRANKDHILPKYLLYYLSSPIGFALLQEIKTGEILFHINGSKLKGIAITLPPSNEQTAIVQYIESEIARIDAKIAKTQRIIELQKEYRTALISEVVTGKIKVPELSIQETTV